MITPAEVLALSLLVRDAGGIPAQRPIAREGAEEIARECNHSHENIAKRCSIVWLVQSFRESGYDLGAVGDGGRARGPFQVWGGRAPRTWKEAVAAYAPLLERSFRTCPEPLELLAAGRCGTRAGASLSRARMDEVRRIEALSQPSGGT